MFLFSLFTYNALWAITYYSFYKSISTKFGTSIIYEKENCLNSFYPCKIKICPFCPPKGRGRRLIVLLAVERELVRLVRVPRRGGDRRRGRGAAWLRRREGGGGGGGGEQGVAA